LFLFNEILLFSILGKRRVAHSPKHSITPRSVTFKSDEAVVEHIRGNLAPGNPIHSYLGTVNSSELLLLFHWLGY